MAHEPAASASPTILLEMQILVPARPTEPGLEGPIIYTSNKYFQDEIFYFTGDFVSVVKSLCQIISN